MATAKKAASKKAAESGAAADTGPRTPGQVVSAETRSAEGPKSARRTDESNMVEVESMRFTRIVDGKRYGPFSTPRKVPESLATTLGLVLTKDKSGGKPQMIDSGKGVERLSGVELPVADEDRLPLTDEEKTEAALAAGRDQDTILERRKEREARVIAARERAVHGP